MTPLQNHSLGGSDFIVPEICLGTMTFGEQTGEADAHAQLDYAMAHGVNFIDTAEMYAVPARPETCGASESIVGRWLFSSPVMGDTEIIEFAMAVVVAGCLPICQWRGDNIIVDFFTTRASAQARARLDRLGAILVAVMMGLIGWRTVVAVFDQKASGSVTMLLQWPEWIAYALMAPPLIITAAMGLYTGLTGRNGAVAGDFGDDPVAALLHKETQA